MFLMNYLQNKGGLHMAQNEAPIILDETEQKIIDIIDAHRDQIINFAKDIYTHAELGYKEFRTAEKFANFMKALGLSTKEHLAVTGVKAYLNEEKKDNVSLALIGELDALRIPEHKYANPETQGAHCCGHHAQLAGVIGAAIALTNPEVKEKLDGQVVLFAVPAEEYGEIEFKNKLTAEGKIKYGGGKCELIRIGAFDDIDLDIVHHIGDKDISGGSTDVGDVQHIQPVLTFNTGGKVSGLHSVDFDIVDDELAYVVTAKIFALSAYRLLKNDAEKAKEVVENYHPIFTKDAYIQYMNSFISVEGGSPTEINAPRGCAVIL